MCTSKTTSTPNIPPMSAEEKQMLSMVSDTLLPIYYEEMGYEVTKVPVKSPGVDGRLPPSAFQRSNQQTRPGVSVDKNGNILSNVAGGIGGPQYTYKIRKKASKKVEQIRETYGHGSSEYKEAYSLWQKEEADSDEANREIQRTFMENAQKFMDGDFSINEEQKKLIQENMAPQRAVLNEMYKEMQSKSDEGFKS